MTQTNPLSDTLVGIPEVCRQLGIGRTTVFELISRGKLQARKLGKRTLVRTSDLQRFIRDLPTTQRGAL